MEDIKDDLTEEEKELLEIDTRRKKYKILSHYLLSDEYKKLVEEYKEKAERMLLKIEQEIENRRIGLSEPKATQSDFSFSLQFYDFQKELANSLGDSEAEQILKGDLLNNADNTYTHLTNKIDQLYDVPSYSDLDLAKKLRMEYALVDDRIETMVGFYNDNTEISNSLNPYEN